MKFDKTITLLTEKSVADGMGGWNTEAVEVAQIKAFITPVKAEVMLKEHGLVTSRAFKIITKTPLPTDLYDGKKSLDFITVQQGNYNYKILQLLDYKFNILLVEVI